MAMTQEERQLLLKDLCARLPYGLKVTDVIDGRIVGFPYTLTLYLNVDYANIRPYLRPMSSMTGEERFEMSLAIKKDYINPDGEIKTSGVDNLLLCSCRQGCNFIDWLNAHHFDYRGLIEKGLAIEAKDGMYC